MRAFWNSTSALVGLVFALPLIAISFQITPEAAGVVFSKSVLWATTRTFTLAVSVGGVAASLALLLVWLTEATDLPGKKHFRWLLVLPLAIPSYVAAVTILMAFGPGGIAPAAGNWIYGFSGCFIAFLFTYPFAYLVIQSSFHDIDPRLWSAARTLGCSPLQAFRRVIFPLLKRGWLAGASLVALYVIGDFGGVSLMRYQTLSKLVFDRSKAGEAFLAESFAVSLALAAIALVIVGMRTKLQKDTVQSFSTEKFSVVNLGKWKNPAMLFCAVIVASFVIFPIAIVVYWMFRSPEVLSFPWRELVTTVDLSLWGAILSLGFGYWIWRQKIRAPAVAAAMLYSLPGVVVGLGMFSVGLFYLPAAYNTVLLLVLALGLRYVALCEELFSSRSSDKLQNLTSAARTLGKTPLYSWIKIELPLTKLMIGNAGLLAFIAIVKELPMTLILAPPGVSTLSTTIWGLEEDAFMGAMGPPILCLLSLSIIGIALRPRKRDAF